MILRPYQATIVQETDLSWSMGLRNVLVVAPTGAGKCLGAGTPILMFDGTVKPVERVVKGDLLMGPDSNPRLVRSTCQGVEPLYRVTPTKGEPYVVNESHILSLKVTGMKGGVFDARGDRHEAGDVVNIGVLDYLASSNTFKHVAKGWRTGVDFCSTQTEFPVPPYVLGIWLGDGTEKKVVSLTKMDEEVVSAWLQWGESIGCDNRVETQKTTDCCTYHLVGRHSNGRLGGSNPALNALRVIGVHGNKHVPRSYLTASRKDRLELLAGVLDTDGYLSNSGYDLVTMHRHLADDIAFLARSLGFACYVAPCRKTCTNNGVTGDYFRLGISGDTDQIPCRIPRRQAKPREQKKSVLVTGITVEPIGVGDYYGFEIDGDRLFMLGDFTVTHNTAIFSNVLLNHTGPACAIAHRQELVSQMSLTLARNGIRHGIVAAEATIRNIVRIHMDELGRSWYDPNAQVKAASVDTLIRMPPSDPWLNRVTLWVVDEAHHVAFSGSERSVGGKEPNKWANACLMMPNARGLGVTATPLRADGRGLGRHHDGLFDHMVLGPSMRWLINEGYLCDYLIYAPPNDIDLSQVAVGASGDYSNDPLRKAVHSSHIVGDVVGHYLKLATGKRGITFCVDIEAATETCMAYRAAGVPAEVISSKTPDVLRQQIMRRFKAGEVLQLTNVDILGEGVDVPAVEVVSMARPTMSYGLFVQQFGRALRPSPGKTHGIIIDHVGNVVARHGLPDAPRKWSLDRRDRKAKAGPSDAIPLRACPSCTQPYERALPQCPWCGHEPQPVTRGSPEAVDGDLHQLSPEVLARMRGELLALEEGPKFPTGATLEVVGAIKKNWRLGNEARSSLEDAMAEWGGVRLAAGDTDRVMQRRFFLTFGVDVLSAKVLRRRDAEELEMRVRGALQ